MDKVDGRFPNIVIPYLKSGMNKSGSSGSKVIKYLAKNHPLTVIPILEEHYRDFYFFRFGKRSSKALHSEFPNLAEKTSLPVLMERMNIWVIFKRLSYDDQLICLKLLVRHFKRGSGHIGLSDWPRAALRMKYFLQLIPLSMRPTVVETVFFELFNKKYVDYPEYWSLEFIEVFPEDYRIRLVEILEKRVEEPAVQDILQIDCRDRERQPKDSFIYLLDFKHAFPMLTEMMSQMTTAARREILLKEMVHNCIINKDADGLESVMRYISIRHKNEDLRLFSNLIMYALMPYTQFINLSVWNWLEKIATLLMIKTNDAHAFGVIMESYIAYRVENNLDARYQVKSVLKLSVVPNSCNFILIRRMEKSYSKILITLFYNEIFCGDGDYAAENVKDRLVLSLLMTINEYNNGKKRAQINVEKFPQLMQGIDKMVKRVRNWNTKHTLATAIKKNKVLRNKYASYLLDMSMKPNTIKYLIKSHPHCVIENFQRIINYIMEYREDEEIGDIFDSRCQVDFLGYFPELARVLSDKFKSSPLGAAKVRALMIYSHITTLEKFLELAKQYVPMGERFNFDTGRLDFYQVVVSIPEMIRNLKPLWKNFDLVAKYMKKDFLRWVLPSFFAVCQNSPVSSTVSLLKQLVKKRTDMAVKKVILGCILNLLPKAERLQYGRMLWENEKNSLLRDFVFHAISRNLRDDQTGEVFEMVKKCIAEADDITISGRIKMRVVPNRYLDGYATALWEFAEKFHDKKVAVICKKEIVSHFNEENISVLSEELCQMILKKYLFKSKGEVFVEKFSVDYILHHSRACIVEHVAFVIGILKEREECQSRPVRYFMNRLKDFVRSKSENVFVVFEELLKQWPRTNGIPMLFKEYLTVEYMNAYGKATKVSESGSKLFASTLGKELRQIVNGFPMYECFVDVFKLSMSDFIKDFSFYDILDIVLENFLGSEFGHVEGIIAIHLIPPRVIENLLMNCVEPDAKHSYIIELREQYMGIFKKLLDKNDEVLKVYMNLRANNVVD